MGTPTNRQPPRPPGVPAAARWLAAGDGAWLAGAVDGDGRPHGEQRTWHRDGAPWRVDVCAHGALLDRSEHRQDGVVEHRASRDGVVEHAIRHTRDGRDCAADGSALPPRPRAVPADARWLPEHDAWLDGAIERASGREVGRWRWWSRAGARLRELDYATRVATLYRERDAIAATGAFVGDRLHGTWRLFDMRGALRRELDVTPLALPLATTASGLAQHVAGLELAAIERLPAPPQLAGVDDEPWPRTDLPRWLRAAVAADAIVRDYALDAIAGANEPRALVWLARLLGHAHADRARIVAIVGASAAQPEVLVAVSPALADRDPLVRAIAALAIGRALGAAAPREVVAGLADAIHNVRELARPFAALGFGDHDLASQVAEVAGAIGTPDARSLAQALCAAIDEVERGSVETFARGMLALAFGKGEPPFAKRFVDILAALARCATLWVAGDGEPDGDDARIAEQLFGAWRLPARPGELAALVTELRAAGDAEAVVRARMRGE